MLVACLPLKLSAQFCDSYFCVCSMWGCHDAVPVRVKHTCFSLRHFFSPPQSRPWTTIGWKCHLSRQSSCRRAEQWSSERPEQTQTERLFTAEARCCGWILGKKTKKHAKSKGGIENCKRDRLPAWPSRAERHGEQRRCDKKIQIQIAAVNDPCRVHQPGINGERH